MADDCTFNYQGILRLADGTLANGTYQMALRIYDQVIGGNTLHAETFSNVVVRDGVFNVVVGDTQPIGQEVFSATPRFLGITVAPDTEEMVPRQRIRPVPGAMKAWTVADSSVTTAKLADGSVTLAKIANSSVPALVVPSGVIVMWSGSISSIPESWVLCDGSNGTPDLRNRFIVGAGSDYSVGATGGEASHTLTIEEMPRHNHNQGEFDTILRYTGRDTAGSADNTNANREPDIITSGTLQAAGEGRPHENRPPYYALAYIMKR